jgi:hypothetical protein
VAVQNLLRVCQGPLEALLDDINVVCKLPSHMISITARSSERY